MRQNLIVALLSVCCTLLVANLYVALRAPQAPIAFGQSGGGDILMAASNTQNEAFCFIYDKSSMQLVSYMGRTSGGLELTGIRSLKSDFNPKIEEYPRSSKKTAVKNMRKLGDSIGKGKR